MSDRHKLLARSASILDQIDRTVAHSDLARRVEALIDSAAPTFGHTDYHAEMACEWCEEPDPQVDLFSPIYSGSWIDQQALAYDREVAGRSIAPREWFGDSRGDSDFVHGSLVQADEEAHQSASG